VPEDLDDAWFEEGGNQQVVDIDGQDEAEAAEVSFASRRTIHSIFQNRPMFSLSPSAANVSQM